jgi:flagellar basal-body rod protein FlgB
MLNDSPLLRLYGAMARHAAQSQEVAATNIAQADTPGYRARMVESFEDYVKRQGGLEGLGEAAPDFAINLRPGIPEPNGNTVSLETEALASASAKGRHDLALGVYGKALDVLRAAIGR